MNAIAGKQYETTFYGGTHDPANDAKISMQFLNSSLTVLSSASINMDVDVDISPFQVGGPFRFKLTAPAGTTKVRVIASVTDFNYVKIDHVSIVACT